MSKIKMKQIVEAGVDSDDPKVIQYARSLKRMLEWRGYSGPDLDALDGDIETYLHLCAKYDKRSAPLVSDITAAGWKAATYRQYQSDGRRMIEHFTGALPARQERRSRDDDWSVLMERAKKLSKAGFIDESRLRSLAKIIDLCRMAEITPRDLTMERLTLLRNMAKTNGVSWGKIVRGAKLLDDLHDYPTLRDVLPENTMGVVNVNWRAKNEFADHLEQDIQSWLASATSSLPKNLVTPEAHKMFRTEHSAGSKGVFAAAIRSYVQILSVHRNLEKSNGLAELFDPASIETVVMTWIRCNQAELPGALSPRSIYRYADCLRLSLQRNDHAEGANKIAELCDLPLLVHGKAANMFMSVETENWCRAMLADPDKVQAFETQHFLYAKRAKAALDDAAKEDFDLVALSNDPALMKKLSARKRGRAKKLLRCARMFGVCAAYSAIALEGAPFRRINMLGLMRSGRRQTFFDHAGGAEPYYEIIMPNELLKNGDALSRRGEALPPIPMPAAEPGDFAVSILDFYIAKIRKLFPGATDSHALFPALDPKHPHLVTSTFDDWLLECSSDIGLPMTSHNFRHGVCSIDINRDPNCLEQLAVLLGDQPETLRRYYAFLDKEKTLRRMQQDRAARRALHLHGRTLAREAA